MSTDAERGGQVGYRVRRDVRRPAPEVIERATQYVTCDLSDAMNRTNSMIGLRAVTPSLGRIAGPAITVDVVVPSTDIVRVGLAVSQPGDVLVLSAHGSNGHAIWGGNLASIASSRGIAAVIIDGAIRDVVEMRALELPTFYRQIVTSAATIHVPHGEVNVPVTCGGVVVSPGDLIVADEDGIVVLPRDNADQILAEANVIAARAVEHQRHAEDGHVPDLDRIYRQLRSEGFADIDT